MTTGITNYCFKKHFYLCSTFSENEKTTHSFYPSHQFHERSKTDFKRNCDHQSGRY